MSDHRAPWPESSREDHLRSNLAFLVLTCSTQEFIVSTSVLLCVFVYVFTAQIFFANIFLSKHVILTECAEFQRATRVWKLSKSVICRTLIFHTYQHLVIIIRSIHASLKVEIKWREIEQEPQMTFWVTLWGSWSFEGVCNHTSQEARCS